MAFGDATINDAGGAVSSLFSYAGDQAKAQGYGLEATNYDNAAKFSDENAQYTEASTRIKEAQQDRSLYQSLGRTTADVAGAGLSGGSGLDILRDNAQQGALAKAVTTEQGAITEEGYHVQADAYRNMAQAARVAEDAANTAGTGALIGGAFKAAASIATLFI